MAIDTTEYRDSDIHITPYVYTKVTDRYESEAPKQFWGDTER